MKTFHIVTFFMTIKHNLYLNATILTVTILEKYYTVIQYIFIIWGDCHENVKSTKNLNGHKKYVYISFNFEMKNNPDMLLSGFVRST